jgi:sulfur-carrier protein adenylyltransferase/sulfurtransferase
MQKLSAEELDRYSRHLVLREFGMEGQLNVKASSVLVVGAGGLGCPALLYLTAAGVGRIGIVDSDSVALSNLQRQILYTVDDVGQSKSDTAVQRLKKINPNVEFMSYPFRITSENALSIVAGYDLVIDGSDNFPTRYLLNDACVLSDRTLVYGSVLKFEGHVSVFNLRLANGSFTSNYRDVFPNPPDEGTAPNCEDAGVLGVLPGMVGTIMASETLKVISKTGLTLADRLLVLDAETMDQTILRIKNQNTRAQITELIDYDLFCGKSQENNKSLPTQNKATGMKEITVEELKELKESGEDFQLIDVREPHEYDICNLEGELIPMSEIPGKVDKINRDKQVVVYCRSGRRSGDTILWLERNHQFKNLFNLKGGILAWAREIDPDMATY